MEVLTESKGDRHPTELAALQGKRLVVAQEVDEGRKWAEAKIKTLAGGDPITARFMRSDFSTYQPQFKLLIAGKHKPVSKNVDDPRRQLNPSTGSSMLSPRFHAVYGRNLGRRKSITSYPNRIV